MSGPLYDVSQTTQSLKWAGLGVTTFALLLGAWGAAANPSGRVYRYAAR